MPNCHHPIPLPFPFYLSAVQLSGSTDCHYPVSGGLLLNTVKVEKEHINENSLKELSVSCSKQGYPTGFPGYFRGLCRWIFLKTIVFTHEKLSISHFIQWIWNFFMTELVCGISSSERFKGSNSVTLWWGVAIHWNDCSRYFD